MILTERGVEEIKKDLEKNMKLLNNIEKDTIYFDGLKNIEESMKKVRKVDDRRRVVVFIDDLDRCSPTKALEVFESIKVFLDIEGFVYVIGLSHETVSKIISAYYKDSGIEGEKYIRKIIQVPIVIPEWNVDDIKELINKLSEKLDEPYSSLVRDNVDIIASTIELNPRESKRFINRFIITHSIFSKNKVDAKALMIVQALQFRWRDFYRRIGSDEKFRNTLKEYVDNNEVTGVK